MKKNLDLMLIIFLLFIAILTGITAFDKTDFLTKNQSIPKNSNIASKEINNEESNEKTNASASKEISSFNNITPIKDIITPVNKFVGKRVAILGTLENIINKNSTMLLVFNDESNKIKAVALDSCDIDTTFLEIGQTYEVSGKLNLYNQEMEIILDNNQDIKKFTPITDLLDNYECLGQKFTISCKIQSIATPKSTTFLKVKDILPENEHSSEIEVVVFDKTNIDPTFLKEGNRYSITGTANLYEDKYQLILNSKQDIEELIPISYLNANNNKYLGNKASIAGTLKKISYQNNNTFLTIGDNGGNIEVVVFANTKIDTTFLKIGNYYSITGKVNFFNEKFQLILNSRNDITER